MAIPPSRSCSDVLTRLELAGEQLAVLPVAEQQAVADALRKLMPASGTT
jgi:hypothetical protein